MKHENRNLVGEAAGGDDVGLKHQSKTNPILFLGLLLGLLFTGCSDHKYTQCEQIFQIAQRLTHNTNSANYFNERQPIEMKSWLEAARAIEQVANHLNALQISNSKLIEYQNQLVEIYRIYSRATYDAVRARENQNFPALESAKDDAQKAGQMQQDLIKQINAYCVNI